MLRHHSSQSKDQTLLWSRSPTWILRRTKSPNLMRHRSHRVASPLLRLRQHRHRKRPSPSQSQQLHKLQVRLRYPARRVVRRRYLQLPLQRTQRRQVEPFRTRIRRFQCLASLNPQRRMRLLKALRLKLQPRLLHKHQVMIMSFPKTMLLNVMLQELSQPKRQLTMSLKPWSRSRRYSPHRQRSLRRQAPRRPTRTSQQLLRPRAHPRQPRPQKLNVGRIQKTRLWRHQLLLLKQRRPCLSYILRKPRLTRKLRSHNPQRRCQRLHTHLQRTFGQ